MRTEILQARVIDPAQQLDAITNIYFDLESIIAIGTPPDGWQADLSVDGEGQWVLPGLVDIAVRLREPGQEQKATVASEVRAALAAGVTSLACLPDTDPPIDSPAQVELVQQKARESRYRNVYVIGALTAGLEGRTLTEMAALKARGCVGVTNAYHPIENTLVLRRALEYAASQNLCVFIQPIDHVLTANGCAHEGVTATRMGLPAIPAAAETSAVGQLIAMVEQTGARTHFCRLSTSRGLQMIERACHDGLPVSADICIHQLFLTDEYLTHFDGNYHTIPPLRSDSDLRGLRGRLHSPALSAICSDHQPHEPDAKLAPFPATQPGLSSIETLLPLCLELTRQSDLGMADAISLLTHKPASVIGIDAGTLQAGKLADVIVVDPAREWVLTEEEMLSAGKNSPFTGRKLQGKVTRTFVGGTQMFTVADK